jgi:hypothetical protein
VNRGEERGRYALFLVFGNLKNEVPTPTSHREPRCLTVQFNSDLFLFIVTETLVEGKGF